MDANLKTAVDNQVALESQLIDIWNLLSVANNYSVANSSFLSKAFDDVIDAIDGVSTGNYTSALSSISSKIGSLDSRLVVLSSFLSKGFDDVLGAVQRTNDLLSRLMDSTVSDADPGDVGEGPRAGAYHAAMYDRFHDEGGDPKTADVYLWTWQGVLYAQIVPTAYWGSVDRYELEETCLCLRLLSEDYSSSLGYSEYDVALLWGGVLQFGIPEGSDGGSVLTLACEVEDGSDAYSPYLADCTASALPPMSAFVRLDSLPELEPSQVVDWGSYGILGKLDQIADKLASQGSAPVDMSGVESRLDSIALLLTLAGAKDVLDDIVGTFDGAATSAASAAVSSAIQSAFPFCAPAIVKQVLGLFEAEAHPPSFRFEIWGAPLDFDFADWEGLAEITRWLCRIGFSVMLLSVSRRFVFMGGMGSD